MQLPATETRESTLLHRAPPGLKLGFVLALILFIALLPRAPSRSFFLPAVLLIIAWILARMPLLHTIRRLLIAEVFIIGMALFVLFSPASSALFLAILIKSNLCVLSLLLLTWTTPFHEILRVLRRAHVPPLMITILALMQRYLPVLLHESRRMQRARSCRTFGRKRGLTWESVSSILGQLFIRTADRAERIYLAMCARGWK